MQIGVIRHPDWYPIAIDSPFEDFQYLLHKKGESGCTEPCKRKVDPTPIQKSSKNRICNSLVVAPLLGAPNRWLLEDADDAQCFQWLLSKNIVSPHDRSLARNWCWVGLKEFGCHRHLHEHISWSKMKALAVNATATQKDDFEPLQAPELCDQESHGGMRTWTDSDRKIARKWFQDNVAVYVLSLRTAVLRRELMQMRLHELGIDFGFSDGVDLHDWGSMDRSKQEKLIPQSFNLSRAQMKAHAQEHTGLLDSIGCAAGHFRAQRQELMRVSPKPVTFILEDDVSPEDDFVLKLWQLLTTEAPCDWEAISLSSQCPFGRCISSHLTRVEPDVNEPAERCRHGVNYGFQGVLYKTDAIKHLQKRWIPVVFDEARPHCLDVDVALASISDKVAFYAVPATQNPGLLRELPRGSSQVDVDFEVKRKL